LRDLPVEVGLNVKIFLQNPRKYTVLLSTCLTKWFNVYAFELLVIKNILPKRAQSLKYFLGFLGGEK
jgi:hypothetical protein